MMWKRKDEMNLNDMLISLQKFLQIGTKFTISHKQISSQARLISNRKTPKLPIGSIYRSSSNSSLKPEIWTVYQYLQLFWALGQDLESNLRHLQFPLIFELNYHQYPIWFDLPLVPKHGSLQLVARLNSRNHQVILPKWKSVKIWSKLTANKLNYFIFDNICRNKLELYLPLDWTRILEILPIHLSNKMTSYHSFLSFDSYEFYVVDEIEVPDKEPEK